MGLLEYLELEEQVGRRWHRWITRGTDSYARHPEAAIALEGLQPALAVFFRGLGGDTGVQIAGTAARRSTHRLSWRQKLGMDEERLDRPSLDETTLYLPPSIDVFPSAELNRRLYFWLAAFFTAMRDLGPVEGADPLVRDIAFLRRVRAATARVLNDFPGLRAHHAALCQAVLAIRPMRRLPPREAAMEAAVRGILGDPAGGEIPAGTDPAGYKPFLPVPLWGEVTAAAPQSPRRPEDDDEDRNEGGAEEEDGQKKRHGQRRQQDQAEREDSLILNRFEKILSLAEMININRSVEDDDEENARKAADDLDEIAVSRFKRKPAVKLKFDLDLPPDAVPDSALTGTHLYPEWDYRRRAYHKAHCRVVTAPAEEEGESWCPDDAARRRIRRVRRQFEALRPRQTLLRRQADGDDLDLEAVVRARCDLMANGVGSDRVFTQFRPTARDLSVALLMDVSLSTDAWVQNRRILDVEKEALTTLCHGLKACDDEHAVFTFTSRRRDLVKVSTVKDFDEPFGETTVRRISALKPGYYTRIGAAIRHVAKALNQRPHRHRLLLVLTDGKPNDVDHYEGRYGIEDSRKAVQEARRAGLAVFGVTIDRKAQDYFPMLFGRGSYAIVGDINRLSAALPKIYRQLVAR